MSRAPVLAGALSLALALGFLQACGVKAPPRPPEPPPARPTKPAAPAAPVPAAPAQPAPAPSSTP